MRILLVMFCLIFMGGCAQQTRNDTSAVMNATSVPVSEELFHAYQEYLQFRDDVIYLKHGFTANSIYADWLERVKGYYNSSGRCARLLAGLAIATRQHGRESSVVQNFEERFLYSLYHHNNFDSDVSLGKDDLQSKFFLSEYEQSEICARQGAHSSFNSLDMSMGNSNYTVGEVARTITFAYTGDTQGVIYPQETHSGVVVGGLSRRAYKINELRRVDPSMILLDAGDTFVRGFARSSRANSVLVQSMNAMRYDAMGLGAHDFNIGKSELYEMSLKAKFPFVCSNVILDSEEQWIYPYVYIERNGFVVAVLSVTQKPDKLPDGARYVDPKDSLDQIMPYVAKKANFLVLLSQFPLKAGDDYVQNNVFNLIISDYRSAIKDYDLANPVYVKGSGIGVLVYEVKSNYAHELKKYKVSIDDMAEDENINKIIKSLK